MNSHISKFNARQNITGHYARVNITLQNGCQCWSPQMSSHAYVFVYCSKISASYSVRTHSLLTSLSSSSKSRTVFQIMSSKISWCTYFEKWWRSFYTYMNLNMINNCWEHMLSKDVAYKRLASFSRGATRFVMILETCILWDDIARKFFSLWSYHNIHFWMKRPAFLKS